MFEVSGISLRFGSRHVLKSVSARVEPGQLTVIAGPNGAGKSTLLKVMTGEVSPDSGSAMFEGREVGRIPAHELSARRAVLPQSSRLAFPFTVLEVVRLGLECRGGISPSVRQSAPRAALQQVGLGDFGGRHYQQLSGGEQQRVHLARILCQIGAPVVGGKPQYLFLDEPVSSLDIRHQMQTLEIARDFARSGGAVLAILHDLNLSAAFADRLIVLHDGQIAADGSPRDVMKDELIEKVFGLKLQVDRLPAPGMPFVLPQSLA